MTDVYACYFALCSRANLSEADSGLGGCSNARDAALARHDDEKVVFDLSPYWVSVQRWQVTTIHILVVFRINLGMSHAVTQSLELRNTSCIRDLYIHSLHWSLAVLTQ